MDKRLLCTIAAVVFVIGGAAVLTKTPTAPPLEDAPLFQAVPEVPREAPIESGASDASTPSSDYAYVIREYEGRVAVFSAGNDTEPEIILDTLVKYLPDYDRTQMQQGIQVQDYTQLVALLEDFAS